MLGANVLDTSSIYSDGDSERLFGRIISELCDKQDITREVCPYEVDDTLLQCCDHQLTITTSILTNRR